LSEALRLADLLAALSLTTDLAMGQPPEKAIRASVVATEVARHMGTPEPQVADVYYTTLLKHIGCTAPSHEESHLFGPDGLGMTEDDAVSEPDMIKGGESGVLVWTAPQPGTYAFRCDVHPDSQGTIIVEQGERLS